MRGRAAVSTFETMSEIVASTTLAWGRNEPADPQLSSAPRVGFKRAAAVFFLADRVDDRRAVAVLRVSRPALSPGTQNVSFVSSSEAAHNRWATSSSRAARLGSMTFG